MKPSMLRAWMRRYGSAGVLMAGLYLVLRHLRTHRRLTIVLASGIVTLLGGWGVRAAFRRPASPALSLPARTVNRGVATPVASTPERPYGDPLFQHAQDVLRADRLPDHAFLNLEESQWVSNTVLFFMGTGEEGQASPQAQLWQYDLRTGRRTRLRQLERLHPFFNHQVKVSPDGRRLFWFKESIDPRTMQAASLEGDGYRQWDFHTNGESWRDWARDSRRWIELERPSDGAAPARITVHDATRTHADETTVAEQGSFEPSPCIYGFGEHLVSIHSPEPTVVTSSLEVIAASLPPHVRPLRKAKIVLPQELQSPHILALVPSPAADRVALIVRHGEGFSDSEQAEITQHVYYDYCLLVCRVDGSAMHSVGSWREPDHDLRETAGVAGLQWLPGGDRLSFWHEEEGILATVSAD